MEKFSITTAIKILKAIGKSPDEPLSELEAEELCRHHESVLTNLSGIGPKEFEAYLTINTCKTYESYAKFILNREKKNLSGKEYQKFLARLRTRTHRGRKKLIKKLKEIYDSGN